VGSNRLYGVGWTAALERAGRRIRRRVATIGVVVVVVVVVVEEFGSVELEPFSVVVIPLETTTTAAVVVVVVVVQLWLRLFDSSLLVPSIAAAVTAIVAAAGLVQQAMIHYRYRCRREIYEWFQDFGGERLHNLHS
jgi:hypothetical protein